MNDIDVQYNIIVPDDSGCSLADLESGELSEMLHLIRQGGKYSWTLQTFHRLKALGLAVHLSHDLNPGCVNLAHGNKLRELEKRWDCFTISLQGDYPHYPLANYHIVQNAAQEWGNASYIPFWPQTGQTPRDSSRHGVRTVAYQGRIIFTDLNAEKLNADLNPLGIEFIALDDWRDLSGIDVLVGIRHYGKKQYKRKPASKLINAWHAGIPFIGGWDSAYYQIGTPDREYLRVASHNELVEAILRLKNDTQLYEKLVSAGAEHAEKYTPETIAQKWVELLEGTVSKKYAAWRCRPMRARLLFASKSLKYNFLSFVKAGLRSGYKVPLIKRIRDLYYDPVG